ncbi:hypothetical protein [Massilia sp. Mn16-1_5]|uniref:hypothetical protein n=1 Tax=Massilia sp. Mn16-1_5 TaxID=2079199 RepID=UPI00109EDCE4|nr:hypothetical protein [Massilia sp. Mn16-1_5]
MSSRRVANVPKVRQRDLAIQFPWLMEVDLSERPENVQTLSVSVFDHWLSQEEAGEKLENVPAVEQARRDALLGDFCSRMVGSTEVISFVQRGRQWRRIIFRRFLSDAVISEYCRPGGGRVFGHRHFQVVLPEFRCAFYESWDDTYHFFFVQPGIAEAARVWASQSGVYLLDR